MKSRVFEFRDSELILSLGMHNMRFCYSDIIAFRKASYWDVLLRTLNFCAKPLVSLPLGVSFKCVIIETKKSAVAVMINRRDAFFEELKERVARAGEVNRP